MSKGELGELFFIEHIAKDGWVVNRPSSDNKPHFCDIFASKGKDNFFFADVKTKARLNSYDATGIDYRCYIHYLEFAKKQCSAGIPFYLVFVDDKNGNVHRANILDLQSSGKEFFIKNKQIICWPIPLMEFLFKLSGNQIAQLTAYDQRNYDYNPF